MAGKRYNKDDQAGSVMLFAIIVLVVMSGIAFVVASLLYREINLARVFDDSLHSYYAAESGVERGLDIIGERRKVDGVLDDTIAAIEAFAPDSAPVTLANSEVDYFIEDVGTSDTANELELPVLEFGGTQVELFDPDDPFSFMTAESVQFVWNHPGCTTTSRIEATFEQFDSATYSIEPDSVYKQVYTCGVETPPADYDCQATSNWPAVNTNYVVRIKPLDCTILGMKVTFHSLDNAAGGLVGVPSRAELLAVGEGDYSQQMVTARTKWLPSASGLVDFVLFSLEAVEK
ncbi:hypothetical protein ACFL2M_00025 [Patescibacteria group bacterium]